MPPARRRRPALSYKETVAKRANVRRVLTLVSPMLESNGDFAVAVPAARAIWESTPGEPADRQAVDVAPWVWLRETAVDAHAFGDYYAAARIGVALYIWQWVLDQDGQLAAATGLVSPPPDVVADLFALGLDCVSRLDARFPLSITQNAVYQVEDVAQRFADGLLVLYSRGYPIDPATYRFAMAVRRPT